MNSGVKSFLQLLKRNFGMIGIIDRVEWKRWVMSAAISSVQRRNFDGNTVGSDFVVLLL